MQFVPKYQQWKGSPLYRIPSLKNLKLEWPGYLGIGIGIGIKQVVNYGIGILKIIKIRS
jgi:hypothetical protein